VKPTPPEWIFDRGPSPDGGLYGFDHGYGDGYDFIGRSEEYGWGALSGWGADGWDLGDWPLVVLVADPTSWALIVRCEGDLTLYEHATREALIARVDPIARYWWDRLGHGPSAAELAAGPPERFSGPYRRSRPAA